MPRACLLVLVGVSLIGCSASWRAPVETRGRQTVAAAPPPPRAVIRGGEYRVQRGDTLYAIAWQSGIDYRLIAAWNGIRPPYRIYAGQTLSLIAPKRVHTPPPAPPVAKSKPRPPPPPRSKPAALPPQRLVWRWPVQGQIVSTFKVNDPLRKGIKITGRGGAAIRSAEGGKVVYSGSGLIGYGRLIIIKHNENYLSAYGHNRKMLVKEGDQVTKGQKIAEMGTANDGQPLLHFEIRRDGKPVDPLRLLPRR